MTNRLACIEKALAPAKPASRTVTRDIPLQKRGSIQQSALKNIFHRNGNEIERAVYESSKRAQRTARHERLILYDFYEIDATTKKNTM